MNMNRDRAKVGNIRPVRECERRPYRFPHIRIVKLENVVMGSGSKKPDGLGQPAGLSA